MSTNSDATPPPTSSPESAGGLTRLILRDGREKFPSGREVAPASLFHKPANGAGLRIDDICGLDGWSSSPSIDLQLSLGSKLADLLDGLGSPECALTWSRWDMPSGPPICRLRASAPRTSGKDSSSSLRTWPTAVVVPNGGRNLDTANLSGGTYTNKEGKKAQFGLEHAAKLSAWNTPTALHVRESDGREAGNCGWTDKVRSLAIWGTPWAADAEKNVRTPEGALAEAIRKSPNNELPVSAFMAIWATPDASVGNLTDSTWEERRAEARKKHGNNGFGLTLGQQVRLTTWGTGTPTQRDWKDGASDLTNTPISGLLGRQVIMFFAETGKSGALAPALSRWLMGFPEEWDFCTDMAVRSSRRPRLHSSVPSWERDKAVW